MGYLKIFFKPIAGNLIDFHPYPDDVNQSSKYVIYFSTSKKFITKFFHLNETITIEFIPISEIVNV